MAIGEIDMDAQRLIDAADRALVAAVAAMRPGGHLGDVGAAVEAVVAAAGYGSPRDYCGHGIGRAMHEEPDVENRGRRGKGPRLEPGVVLAIEPMLIAGGHDDVLVLDDDWTVVTADGSLAAHTEHTVVVTDHGPRSSPASSRPCPCSTNRSMRVSALSGRLISHRRRGWAGQRWAMPSMTTGSPASTVCRTLPRSVRPAYGVLRLLLASLAGTTVHSAVGSNTTRLAGSPSATGRP